MLIVLFNILVGIKVIRAFTESGQRDHHKAVKV
jgi:hypothetical protein